MNVRHAIYGVAAIIATASFALGEDPKPNAYEGAKVGQWTLSKIKLNFPGMKKPEEKYLYTFITKVDGRKTSFVKQEGEAQRDDKDNPLKDAKGEVKILWKAAGKPYTFDADVASKDSASTDKPKESEEELEFKGKKIKCKKMEHSQNTPMGKITATFWTNADVPIDHLVKSVQKDPEGHEIQLTTLEDYGQTDGKERK